LVGGFDEDQIWDVVDDFPEDSAAVVLLLEHRWAIPLRDAVYRGSGSGSGSRARRRS